MNQGRGRGGIRGVGRGVRMGRSYDDHEGHFSGGGTNMNAAAQPFHPQGGVGGRGGRDRHLPNYDPNFMNITYQEYYPQPQRGGRGGGRGKRYGPPPSAEEVFAKYGIFARTYTPEELAACICDRKVTSIYCSACGFLDQTGTRRRRTCPTHPRKVYYTDFERCPNADCDNELKEVLAKPKSEGNSGSGKTPGANSK